MTKRPGLPSYIWRRPRDGVLHFRKRIAGKVVFVRLRTQFPEGAEIPLALHQERESLLRRPVPVPEGRSVGDVVTRYKAGPRWDKLAARTRADYVKRLDFFRAKIGHIEPRHITRRHVIEWQSAWAKAAGPHEANYRLRVLKILLEAAIDAGLVTANPAKGVPEISYEKRDRQPWPKEKIDDFREYSPYDTRERLCFELLLGTGQRIGDVLRMQWGHIEGDGINVRQGKTGKKLWVPFTAHLKAAVAAAPRRGLTILTSRHGGPWAYRSAAQAMRKARDEVGALDYDLHGLRYAACVELFLAGCTDDEISAITGQSRDMVLHYTRHHRQKVLALRARGKRNENET